MTRLRAIYLHIQIIHEQWTLAFSSMAGFRAGEYHTRNADEPTSLDSAIALTRAPRLVLVHKGGKKGGEIIIIASYNLG